MRAIQAYLYPGLNRERVVLTYYAGCVSNAV